MPRSLQENARPVALGTYVLAIGVLLTLVATGMRNADRRWGTGAGSPRRVPEE